MIFRTRSDNWSEEHEAYARKRFGRLTALDPKLNIEISITEDGNNAQPERFHAHASAHTMRHGSDLHVHANADDLYTVLDRTSDKLLKSWRRWHEKHKSH